MIETKLTAAQKHLRVVLLQAADATRAAEVSNELTEVVCEAFNQANTNMATSLLARSLFIYAMADVAANWWADVTGEPLPDTHAAITDLAFNMPPIFAGESYRVDKA